MHLQNAPTWHRTHLRTPSTTMPPAMLCQTTTAALPSPGFEPAPCRLSKKFLNVPASLLPEREISSWCSPMAMFHMDDVDEVRISCTVALVNLPSHILPQAAPAAAPPLEFVKETNALARLQSQATPIENELARVVESVAALTAVFSSSAETTAVAKLLATKYASAQSLVAVLLRTGHPGTSLASCLHTLRHTVIVVRGLAATDLLVDPSFRSQFYIPHAPAAYHEFLRNHVPAIFVGTESRARAVVDTLADVVAAVYKQHDDATLPPWRKRAALLSKFVPTAYDEATVMGDDQALLVDMTREEVGGDSRAVCNALMDGMSSLIAAAKSRRLSKELQGEASSPRSVFLAHPVPV